MALKKLIKKDTEILTEKIHADDYINTKDLSYRKELVVVADKMESLIMELKPYVSNEQFIELMRETSEPNGLYPIIKKLVPQLYHKDSAAGLVALELQIFLEDIVLECFCGAYELEDYTYSVHSVKNVVLKKATEKAEAKVMAQNYLKYTKSTNTKKTVENKEKAVEKKIEELKATLKPYLSQEDLKGLDDMEKLGCIIPDLYAEGKTTAFNTAVELRAVIDCLREECYANSRKINEIEHEIEAKQETEYYDSLVKDFTSGPGMDEFSYTFLYSDDQTKRLHKFEKIVCARSYFQGFEITDNYNEILLKKLNQLKETLKPYLSESGYQELLDANPDGTVELLSHLLDRLEKCDKVAGDKVLEIKAFIKIWFKENGKNVFNLNDDDEFRKKVTVPNYFDCPVVNENYKSGMIIDALFKKYNELKTALKPHLSEKEYNKLLAADPVDCLDMLPNFIFMFYFTNNKVAFNLAKELEAFIEYSIFNLAEQQMNASEDNSSDEEIEQEPELDEEEIKRNEKYQKDKATYNSYVKDYHLDIDELYEKNDYEGYFAFDKIEEKYYHKFRKQFIAKKYISTQDFEARRQIITDKLNKFKAALKPHLTEAGYQKLLATNPSDLSRLVCEEFGTRFYQINNINGIIAAAQLRAFAETVVRDFAEQDMKVDDYQKKVMTEDYLGDYQNYSTATYQKMHELKTALKPYLPKKEYLELLVESPLGTQEILSNLISRFYYDEHNSTAASIVAELRELIQCRVVESYSYNFF